MGQVGDGSAFCFFRELLFVLGRKGLFTEKMASSFFRPLRFLPTPVSPVPGDEVAPVEVFNPSSRQVKIWKHHWNNLSVGYFKLFQLINSVWPVGCKVPPTIPSNIPITRLPGILSGYFMDPPITPTISRSKTISRPISMILRTNGYYFISATFPKSAGVIYLKNRVL